MNNTQTARYTIIRGIFITKLHVIHSHHVSKLYGQNSTRKITRLTKTKGNKYQENVTHIFINFLACNYQKYIKKHVEKIRKFLEKIQSNNRFKQQRTEVQKVRKRGKRKQAQSKQAQTHSPLIRTRVSRQIDPGGKPQIKRLRGKGNEPDLDRSGSPLYIYACAGFLFIWLNNFSLFSCFLSRFSHPFLAGFWK